MTVIISLRWYNEYCNEYYNEHYNEYYNEHYNEYYNEHYNEYYNESERSDRQGQNEGIGEERLVSASFIKRGGERKGLSVPALLKEEERGKTSQCQLY